MKQTLYTTTMHKLKKQIDCISGTMSSQRM